MMFIKPDWASLSRWGQASSAWISVHLVAAAPLEGPYSRDQACLQVS